MVFHSQVRDKKSRMKPQILALAALLALIAIGANGCSQAKLVCNTPYIQVGSECCLDKNSNKICDKDEEIKIEIKESQIPEDIKECVANDFGLASFCNTTDDCFKSELVKLIVREAPEFKDLIFCESSSYKRIGNEDSEGKINFMQCATKQDCTKDINLSLDLPTNEYLTMRFMSDNIICENNYCMLPRFFIQGLGDSIPG